MKTTIYSLIPELIEAQNIEATFVKANGEERTMECIFESTRYINQGILTVFDMEKRAYRSINIKTLKHLCINNDIMKVTENGNLMYSGNRRTKMIDLITNLLGYELSDIFANLDYYYLENLYQVIEDLNHSKIEAVKALFEYFFMLNYIDINEVKEAANGNLEFIPNATLEQVAEQELFGKLIPTPDYWNIEYADYKYTVEDLQDYYFEASNGVIQVWEV